MTQLIIELVNSQNNISKQIPVIKKLKKWWRYPRAFKFLLLKATALSLFHEIVLRLKVYEPIKSMHIQEPMSSNKEEKISSDEMIQLRQISKSMDLLEKFAPWKPMCYNRALTAKKLLKNQNINVRMHIGFRKKEDVFDGHAWISYKGKIVTGYLKEINTFKELKPLNY